jgi:hypothetical protein
MPATGSWADLPKSGIVEVSPIPPPINPDGLEAAAVIEELTEALIDARPYLEAYAQQNAGTATHLQDMMNALFAKIDAALTKAQGDGNG